MGDTLKRSGKMIFSEMSMVAGKDETLCASIVFLCLAIKLRTISSLEAEVEIDSLSVIGTSPLPWSSGSTADNVVSCGSEHSRYTGIGTHGRLL